MAAYANVEVATEEQQLARVVEELWPKVRMSARRAGITRHELGRYALADIITALEEVARRNLQSREPDWDAIRAEIERMDGRGAAAQRRGDGGDGIRASWRAMRRAGTLPPHGLELLAADEEHELEPLQMQNWEDFLRRYGMYLRYGGRRHIAGLHARCRNLRPCGAATRDFQTLTRERLERDAVAADIELAGVERLPF